MAQSSIETILEVKEHPNADKLELAIVKGWQVVVQKGQFKAGDKAFYIEIDSLIKRDTWNEFLFKDSDKQEYRLKTVRLRGELSQGILFTLDNMCNNKQGFVLNDNSDLYNPNCDLAFGITKYDKPAPNDSTGIGAGSKKHDWDFPTHLISKTDEPRIQNFPNVLDEISNTPCYVSTKIDGTSATYVLDKKKGNFLQKLFWKLLDREFKFHVCSRNLSLREGDSVYWKMAKKYDIEYVLARYQGRYGIQGEIYGSRIQGNPLKIEGIDLAVFNVIDLSTKTRLTYIEMIEFCNQNNLNMVPHYRLGKTTDKPKTLQEALELAKGNYEATNTPREGIVIRSCIPTYSEALRGDLSFKIINNDYLEKVEQ